ncbi:MAG: FmdE family protein [Oscillospiraceae bacterium]
MTDIEKKDLWKKCADFHGHVCDGLTIGYKAALYLLDVTFSKDEEVICISENDACGVDAIQVALVCSVGKGNLLFHMLCAGGGNYMTIIQQVAQRHGQIISGVYQSASHRIVPVSDCMIEDTVADEIIVTIRSLLKSFKIHPYDEDTGRDTLRHVLVRRGLRSGEILVVLVTAHGMPPGKRNFVRALLQRHPDITTIVQNINAGKTSLVLGPHSEVLYGPGYIHEQLGDFTFRISPRAFQDLIYLLVALGVSVVLFFPFVRQIIGRSKRVFDALMRIMDAAGLGIFTITGLNTAITLAGCTDPLLLVFVGRLSGWASCIIVFPALGHIVPKPDVKSAT